MIAYLRIIRPLNLLIIILTQILLRYFVLSPLLGFSMSRLQISTFLFIVLVLSTVLIAAAGYVINDILDTGMDAINKPGRKIIGSLISEKKARTYYNALNIAGVAAGFYVSYMIGKPSLTIIHVIAATMLFYYSYKYKYLPGWGNLAVSFLAALVLIMVWLFEYFAFRNESIEFVNAFPSFRAITIFTLGYAFFAFLISFIREIIKDMQDVKGDQQNGCRTWPVIYGIPVARKITSALILFTIITLAFFQVILYNNNYLTLSLYLMIMVQLPLIVLLTGILKVKQPQQTGRYSSLVKLIMLTGILSMVLIKYNLLVFS